MTKDQDREGRIARRALSALSRRGFREGLLGGDRAWLAVWVAVTLWRRRRRGRGGDVVYLEPLTLGQRLVIEHQPPPLRGRQARRARREARRQAAAEE